MIGSNEHNKTALYSFLVLIASIIILLGLYIVVANIIGGSLDDRTPEEKAAEIAAEGDFFPKLDKLYSSGDYDGMVELIYSTEAENINIRNYSHYDLAEFYRNYIKVKDYYTPMLDKGNLTGFDAREMTSIVFSFYYRCYDQTMGVTGNSTEDDIIILDNIRDQYMLGILCDRMGYSLEDMEAGKKDIMKDNYFHSDIAYKYSDRYFERYR